MRPIAHRSRVSMLDRIDVDVVDVMAKIGLVAHRMFPVASLPHTAFASRDAHGGAIFDRR
jgi:hypothetical protein